MAECKDCKKNVACVERRFFGGNQKNCKEFEEKTYTLKEIATAICCSYGDECPETCPGFNYCSINATGVLEWLREVVKDGTH